MTGPADPAALARLHALCFSIPRPWSEAEFAALSAAPGTFCIGDSDGFVIGRVAAGEAELLTLAVHPEARRQGIGARLLRGFETEAAARGADAAFLEVAQDNAPAVALYRGAGFTTAGRRRGYYRAPGGPPVDAIVMRKPLSPAIRRDA